MLEPIYLAVNLDKFGTQHEIYRSLNFIRFLTTFEDC